VVPVPPLKIAVIKPIKIASEVYSKFANYIAGHSITLCPI
jgi:hypothetical protein